MTDVTAPNILLNDFKRQWADIRADVTAAVETVGASGWYILGQQVAGFERALAGCFGRQHAIGCASGLDAIELGLRAAGLRPGDRVLTTPLSAFATTLAIVRAGGVPVYVDVDQGGLIDLSLCEAQFGTDPALRWFVPVHLYGQSLDPEHLAALRDRFQLEIVEDCAQSIGASRGGRLTGTVGQLAATSFYPTKNLGALGDGGAVLTDDPALRDRTAALRDYGQSARYVHDLPGLNSRLDELQAAILAAASLPRLPTWTERRRAIAQQYLDGISHPQVRLCPPPGASRPSWHLFPVFVPAAAREPFRQHLRTAGVETGLHYPRLITEQQALVGTPHQIAGGLPSAERLIREQVSLPIHPYLRDDEVAKVIDAVNAWTA